MDQSIDKKIDFKDKLFSFYNNNKIKIYSILIIFFISMVSFYFVKHNEKKKNNLAAERYIKAVSYLSSNANEEARKILEDIILSKNKFYSILAFNLIIEKNLVSDERKILEYFSELEKINIPTDEKDLIIIKKALYFFKTSKNDTGNKLLKELINKNSKLKSLAEEIMQ